MKDSLFDGIPGDVPDELSTVLAEGGGVRIERIVSAGHASPEGFWYDQDEDEWVLLAAGSARLSIETGDGVGQVALAPGDHLLIPAHCRHRVDSTAAEGKTVWLAVFYPPASAERCSTA